MTNETTASQPKSIGDDAQFIDLLGDFAYARREGSFDQKRAAPLHGKRTFIRPERRNRPHLPHFAK